MAVVQGFVEGDILPGGGDRRIFLMTPPAGLWTALLARPGQFAVAGNAVDMVGVGHRLPIRIDQTFEFGRQAPLVVGHVAGVAVPAYLGQGFGVAAVEKGHRWPFQRAQGLHGVDYDQIRPAFHGPSTGMSTFTAPAANRKTMTMTSSMPPVFK
jgi:hypothetical protein